MYGTAHGYAQRDATAADAHDVDVVDTEAASRLLEFATDEHLPEKRFRDRVRQ